MFSRLSLASLAQRHPALKYNIIAHFCFEFSAYIFIAIFIPHTLKEISGG
jgi:hypothetical protein